MYAQLSPMWATGRGLLGGRGVESKMVRVKYPESWGWLAVTLALTTAAVTGKKETYSASAICAEFLHTKYRKVGRDYVHGSIARFRADPVEPAAGTAWGFRCVGGSKAVVEEDVVRWLEQRMETVRTWAGGQAHLGPGLRRGVAYLALSALPSAECMGLYRGGLLSTRSELDAMGGCA